MHAVHAARGITYPGDTWGRVRHSCLDSNGRAKILRIRNCILMGSKVKEEYLA